MSTAIDAFFDAIGLAAALAHPAAKLWADANCVDNFTQAISDTIDDAIVDAVNTDDNAHCAWLYVYVKDAGKSWKPSYKGDYPSPYLNLRVCRIAKTAYEKLRAVKVWVP